MWLRISCRTRRWFHGSGAAQSRRYMCYTVRLEGLLSCFAHYSGSKVTPPIPFPCLFLFPVARGRVQDAVEAPATHLHVHISSLHQTMSRAN